MPALLHKTIIVKAGETVDIPSTTTVAGSHLEADGKGGFVLVLHVLEPTEGIPLANGHQKAMSQ